MNPTNVLFICSDQQARNALGCYGHPLARTPHLDALVAAGTRFSAACSISHICVPARAAIATGCHVHQCRAWSGAEPYDGNIEGWGCRLIEEGRRVVSIGKLHYRSGEDPNGFDTEILTMHVHAGVGWATALLRETRPMGSGGDYARDIGWGESAYTRYDRAIGDAACRWLRDEAPTDPARPWVLCVSFVSPHNPVIAPPEYESWYPRESVEMPGPTAGKNGTVTRFRPASSAARPRRGERPGLRGAAPVPRGAEWRGGDTCARGLRQGMGLYPSARALAATLQLSGSDTAADFCMHRNRR